MADKNVKELYLNKIKQDKLRALRGKRDSIEQREIDRLLGKEKTEEEEEIEKLEDATRRQIEKI